MVDVVRCDRQSGQAGPMPQESRVRIECPWCGPFYRRLSDVHGICPKCDLTPAEHAYIARILADSDAVYAEELRAFQAQRRPSPSKGGT